MDYEWTAQFEDGKTLSQFPSNEKETLFGEVEKNKDKLIKFKIETDNKEFYEVNLIEGTLNCNGKIVEDFDIPKGKKADLIYGRRKTIIKNVKTTETKTVHRIGLKYKDSEKVLEVFPGFKNEEKSIKIVETGAESRDLTKKLIE